MPSRQSLLGFAFAASDLLIELDEDARVTFAVGAGPGPGLAAEDLDGRPLSWLIAPADLPRLAQAIVDIGPGGRIGPIAAAMRAGEGLVRPITFSAFRLPGHPGLSCAVSWRGEVVALANDNQPPILDAEGFLKQARAFLIDGPRPDGLALDFIDVGELPADAEVRARLLERVETVLKSASLDGDSAAHLAPRIYALMHDSRIPRDLTAEVSALGRSEGVRLKIESRRTAIPDAPPLNILRALRFAAEGCLKEGSLSAVGRTFDDALARTVSEGEKFRAMVRDRAFEVHYQPIIDLRTGAVHHFEALTRFRASDGPGETIRMAEELGLIETFDRVVLEKVVKRLNQPGSGLLKIAVNVSGASLADDGYVHELLALTAETPDLRRRLIVEVTESAALADVQAADRRLSMLRAQGIHVCIDDFGAGAASFDYIRKLRVDTVKIDGGLVRGVGSDPRARTLIAHLVELCGSLGLSSIAEMVETQTDADVLRDLGVGYAQGWLFGRAEAEPRTSPVGSGPVAARRRGVVEGWG